MKVHDDEFVTAARELAIAAAIFEVDHGNLSVIPPELWSDIDEGRFEAELASLSERDRTRFRDAVATLASPVRVASFHYTMADEAVSRHLLAWPVDGDEVVFLTRSVNAWRLGRRSVEQIGDLMVQVLAARERVEALPLGFELSPAAALTFLAALDVLRLARLQSQLVHESPQVLLSPMAVTALLGTGSTEDFRSPFLFFEKLLAVSLDTDPPEDEIIAAFTELQLAGLVESLEGTQLFELTEIGEGAADAVLHEVSKVGLRLTESHPDGRVGHDSLLLIRSAFRLLLFEVDGPLGVVASLDGTETEDLLARLLAAPTTSAVNASRADTPCPTVGWARTHIVPNGGLDARALPEADAPPTLHLQADVELQVVTRWGDWAEVVASNGWTAWVDNRLLIPDATD